MAAELNAVEVGAEPTSEFAAGAADHQGAPRRDNDIMGLMRTLWSRHCSHRPADAAS
jgi:hypothetical protein